MAVLAMFPLGMAVLPGSGLPLQVFEPRYVQMVRDLLAGEDTPSFGTVLIERGHEVGGADDRNDVGTLVRIADMSVTPDGRYLVAGVGAERLRVERWLPDDPYPRAEVDLWPDQPSDVGAAELARRLGDVRTKAIELADLVRELGHELGAVDDGLDDDPSLALYQLAARSPLGPADRYRILAAPSAAERCDVLEQALDDAMAVIEFHRS
jgi:Lon protease-like protein